MSILKVWQNGVCREIAFVGTPLLSRVLTDAGLLVAHPCGGRGSCGKCAINVEGCVSKPTDAEQRVGSRLSCQTVLLGDATLYLGKPEDYRADVSGIAPRMGKPMGEGYGCAIDIGTTTLALRLYDLRTGEALATRSRLNPQYAVAADVMGRIDAAMRGQAQNLRQMMLDALEVMLVEACAYAGIPRDAMESAVVAGNTTMLYLLCGRDTGCLSCAPFAADTLFDVEDRLLGMRAYYPGCMNAFVGADITCAVLVSGIHRMGGPALLCDIGTNGEIALWKDGRLFVTSTAAGPAFEGVGISCGCGSIPGAIDRIWVEEGEVRFHTIGNLPAVGICGSGLVDGIAAYLETSAIDETGAMDADYLPLANGLRLLPGDVRAVQLAKAAIAAGIHTLLEMAQVDAEDIHTFYIAGGFGSHLNVASAGKIGLVPPSMQDKVQILGNAALAGAAQMLLDVDSAAAARKLVASSVHLNLGGNPRFNMYYVEQMLFGDADLFDED